ncbi:hypothetical protein C0J52_08878 [Blattella germanica]|nr:hypothetical protein C0J52_08878 [Blattella germanica]
MDNHEFQLKIVISLLRLRITDPIVPRPMIPSDQHLTSEESVNITSALTYSLNAGNYLEDELFQLVNSTPTEQIKDGIGAHGSQYQCRNEQKSNPEEFPGASTSTDNYTYEKEYLDRHNKFNGKTQELITSNFEENTANLKVSEHRDEYVPKDNLNQHLELHSEERLFKCGVCGESFLTQDAITQHLMIHTGNGPYNCDKCDMMYPSEEYLQLHKISYH